MVYQLKRTQTNKRPQAFWGSLIPSALGFVGGLITSSQQAKAQRRALEEQQRLAKQQLDINNQNQLASTLNNYALAQQSYDDKDYNLKYRIGGVKRLGSRNIMITDGGTAKRIGNNTYLLRGGSHEDINETGQTGIGINVGGNEIEAEGGEVAQRKGNSLRIYSAQPILGGISPAEAIMRGYNKDRVFNAQQRFKKNNGIKDDGSQQRNGGLTSKDRGSSKHPYPSVASKDFAGSNRSYPIPTKADAIDALRLAGLHGRSDVRSKVYSKYPELRKKADFGTDISLSSSYDNEDFLSRITKGHPIARKIVNEIFGDAGIRTTPQYKGSTTKGNYQLHDGETKVINGIKYTRRGNTIINHKTNVGYIYDKNGNYTGQADYSKVGNFNQAFDTARAAGRNQFIYRAGKYNNYSTIKETNAKKEALNRRVGARRIAKRMGGLTNPPVERFKCGGRVRPKAEDGMLAPIYSYGTNRRRLPSFAPIDVTPRAIPNFKPVSVPTNVKTPFDPNSVPFLGKQSTFKPVTQDYIGLGIDTLAALGSGMFTRSAYNKMNFDYALPNYVDESPVAFDTTYHNEAQRANIERNRLNARNLIRGNTASAQTSLSRMQQSDVDAMMETNKLLDEKSNKEVELRNQNAANEQQVRARNAAARNQYYQNVAQIKNAAIEAKNNAELAKAQSIGADLSGLSQAWTNFAGSVESRYDNRQKEAIIAATAKDPAVLSNAVQFGYNFSPEVLAAIYNSTDDDNLKSLALSQLSTKNRLRYGIR